MFWKTRTELPHHLPLTEGPYATGCTDIMTGYGMDSRFFRLFYPTDIPASDVKKYHKRWVLWKFDDMSLKGAATFLQVWTFILRLIIWLFTKDTYTPTIWEEPLSTKAKKMPIVIFSHGYGANRFLCSTVCNELASRGCVVASVEHKDHSACVTHYYESKEHYERDEKYYVLIERIPRKRTYVSVRRQLPQRSSDCIHVLNWFQEANGGNATNILKTNFDMKSLKDRLDLSRTIVMGHSFGGATAMYTLKADNRFKVGIVLDGWMFPIKEEAINIQQPILFINSQTFHVKSNIQVMKKYIELKGNVLYTMRNTTHESHTDTAVIYGYWLNKFMKKLCARTALRIQNNLILDFLHKKIGIDIDEESMDEYLKRQNVHIVEDFILHNKSEAPTISLF